MGNSKSVKSFLGKVNKEAETDIAGLANSTAQLHRLSSGSLEMDIALGGGWPRGRMSLLYGPEGCGKTTACTKASVAVQNTCVKCWHSADVCTCRGGKASRGVSMIVDEEGTFDKEWAQAQGLDTSWHALLRPECGEQTVEIVNSAILEGIFDLIILDSIEQCVPLHELETSAEDAIVGGHAKMMNRAFRKWTSSCKAMKEKAPTMLFTNQPRMKIGVGKGDPTTLPGGKGQLFSCGVHTRFKKVKYHSAKGEAVEEYAEISGSIPRNKTAIPRKEFTFHFALRETGLYQPGDINNAESCVKHGRQLGIISCGKGDWYFDFNGQEVRAKGKDMLIETIQQNPDIREWFIAKILEMKE